jgi:hypothetical protein
VTQNSLPCLRQACATRVGLYFDGVFTSPGISRAIEWSLGRSRRVIPFTAAIFSAFSTPLRSHLRNGHPFLLAFSSFPHGQRCGIPNGGIGKTALAHGLVFAW